MTAAEVTASAAIREGKYAQAFPEYGPERRGAPVKAYTRVDDEPILEREPVLHPNVVVVLDPTLEPEIYMQGMKEDGALIINTVKEPAEVRRMLEEHGLKPPKVVATVDATEIALKHLKRPIVNTAMIAAMIAAVPGIVKLESVEEVLREWFADKGERIVQANIECIREAYKSTRIG